MQFCCRAISDQSEYSGFFLLYLCLDFFCCILAFLTPFNGARLGVEDGVGDGFIFIFGDELTLKIKLIFHLV